MIEPNAASARRTDPGLAAGKRPTTKERRASMDTSSLWKGTAAKTACLPTLQTDLKVDVAIVGAGITGLTAAMLLVQAGKRVAVLDAYKAGDASTGNSTGNLYATVDLGLHTLEEKHGLETMRRVVESRAAAIDLIEATVARLNLDCGFQRLPWHLVACDAAHVAEVEKEALAAMRARLHADLRDDAPLPIGTAIKTLRVEDQAQFQPLTYVRQLAQRIGGEDCLIFENTRVTAIEDAPAVVHTTHGKVQCQQVIIATHTPIGIHLVQSQLEVVREYGIAAPLHDSIAEPGIYWCLGEGRHSIRTYTEHGRTWLVAIGSAHSLGGQEVGQERFQQLELFARDHFPIGPVEYRWSAQRYRAKDKLPCIGRNVDAQNTYIATGFSGDGLTYGTLAGMMLADEILGRGTPWRDLYAVGRLEQGKRPDGFEKESTGPARPADAVALDAAALGKLDDLPPCQGRKVEIGGQPLAFYRGEDGRLLAVAGKCSHMGCEIKWNGAESSWDCDCHGSRFAPDGRVLEGPALAPLQAAKLDKGA
jgi:glycine/D-amino acid oxidase-like deaminating enzyme/nitrite reductase/ring-hydroxylating ferredoxin subunit